MKYMSDDQAKRGTWKAHGKPSVIRYYGRTNGEPTAESDLATVEALPGGLIRITNMVDDHVETIGAASLFYAAPTTMDEANGTGEHGAPPATPFGDSLIAMVDEMTAEPEVAESALVTVGTDRYGRAIPEGCKDIKLNLSEAWRTTYTHIQARDMVRIERTDNDTPGKGWKASGTAAPKRSYWAEVADVTRTARGVQLTMVTGEITVEAAHTAITRQERETEYRARLDKDAQDRAASVEANRPKVKAHPVQIAGNVGSAYVVVNGHEAESHSRRGHECRICGEPVVRHADVKVTDGVAVAWWTGTIYSPDAVLNPERVALVEARREAESLIGKHVRVTNDRLASPRLGLVTGRHETTAGDQYVEINFGGITDSALASCVTVVTPEAPVKPACECPTPDAFHYSGCPALIAAFKGVTADGHKITHGLAVWDYNREPGYVNLDRLGDDGWFHVVKAGETRGSLMNAERVCVVDPYNGQSATQALEVLAYVAANEGTEKYETARGAYAWRYVAPVEECPGCPRTNGQCATWCPLVTPTKCECESFVCEFEGAHALCKCPNQATETHFVALCPGCAVTVRQPVSPEAHAAFLAWEATEQERRMAEETAEIAALPDVETQVAEISTALANGTARWSREKGKGRKARKGKRKAQKHARKISRKGH